MIYEGGPMNDLVGLLVKCPDRHDSYLRGYAQTDGTLPWRQEIGAESTIVYLTVSYLEMIAIDKKYNQSFLLTFILLGHFSSAQELSYRPSQHVFGHKQRTDEQRKTVLGK